MINKKNLWAITDGSSGMISQVIGLSKYLSNNISQKKIEVKWPWSKLQPGILPPFSNKIFNSDFLDNYPPEIVVSCGRKSVYASLYLKKILKKDLISIHIQNPKIKTSNFDFVITPNHDDISGENVLCSVGALNHITNESVKTANKMFDVPKEKKIVAVLLGGENNHYSFSKEILIDLINRINNLNKKERIYYFLFISSRRTPKYCVQLIHQYCEGEFYVWDNNDPNPYLYAIKIADFFILTSDTISMISEASSTGKPIFIFHLPYKRKSARFESFHREFRDRGITMPFDNNLYPISYEPLNESKRIAGILNTRILNRIND
ncbi:MAG: hypothetical protein CMI95_05365 [Pelagibacteraceae bacterium]|nr:hypothetical protein [Pelagibacteraceae bacterium]PPR51668.1 MAG: hypothetical protein CFH20_00454 [Alphaproteobacteria bacterium MarineAlpha5_Bin10]